MKKLFILLVFLLGLYSSYSQNHKIAIVKEGGKDTAYFDRIIINDGHKRMSESDYYLESAIKTSDKIEKLNLLDTAIALYNSDTAIIFNGEELYNERGKTEDELGKIKDAISDYITAISINPSYSKPYSNMGNIYLNLNQIDSATILYKRAISINPNDSYAYNGLGIIDAQSGKFSEAITEFKKAISVEPSYVTSYFNLGLAYKDSHNDDSAIHFYSIAIDKNPNYLDAIYYRAKSYSNLKKYNSAIQDFSKLILSDNKNYEIRSYFGRGKAYMFSNNFAEAQSDYDKCLTISNSKVIKSKTYYMIAQNYTLQDKIEAAKEALRLALKLNPNYVDAQRTLAEISK